MNAWDFSPYFPGISITAVAETRSSWLLFTTDQVMKILKPSKRSARDLSTPEARRIVLDEELELLKRFAPGVADRLQPLKNQEQIVDVALVMRRLPRGANLLVRLLTKRATAADFLRVGSTLAKIHAKSPADASDAGVSSVEELRNLVDQAAQPLLDPGASMFLSHDVSVRVRDKLLGILHTQQAAFLQRSKKRGVRLIHGALHAENVYVEEGSVSFLDASRNVHGSVVGDGLLDLAAIMKDVRLYATPDDSVKLVQGYFGTDTITPEMEQLLHFYELLWTMRQFTQHTAALTEGIGGQLDTEMVQRYRSRLMRSVATQFAPTALQVHEKRTEEAKVRDAKHDRHGDHRNQPHRKQEPQPQLQGQKQRHLASRRVADAPSKVTAVHQRAAAKKGEAKSSAAPGMKSKKQSRVSPKPQPKRAPADRKQQPAPKLRKKTAGGASKKNVKVAKTLKSAPKHALKAKHGAKPKVGKKPRAVIRAGAKKQTAKKRVAPRKAASKAARAGSKRSRASIGQKLRSFLGIGGKPKRRA